MATYVVAVANIDIIIGSFWIVLKHLVCGAFNILTFCAYGSLPTQLKLLFIVLSPRGRLIQMKMCFFHAGSIAKDVFHYGLMFDVAAGLFQAH